MRDLAKLSLEEIRNYTDSVFNSVDQMDISYDGNYAFMLYNSARVCLIDFILITQPYCKDMTMALDADFICNFIGDLEFFRQLFDEYVDENPDKKESNYFKLALMQNRPEESHKIITDIVKSALKEFSSVYGTIISLQPNGAGVVRLDDGRNAYFDRFSVLSYETHEQGKLKEWNRIEAKVLESNEDIVRLTDVALLNVHAHSGYSDNKRSDDYSSMDDTARGFKRFNINVPLPKIFKSTVSKTPERDSIFPHFEVNVRFPDFSKRRKSEERK